MSKFTSTSGQFQNSISHLANCKILYHFLLMLKFTITSCQCQNVIYHLFPMSISKHTSCQFEKSISLLANVKIQYHFFLMSKFKCTCQCQNSLQWGWISFQWHQEYSMLRSSCEFRKCDKQQTRLQSTRPSCFTTPIYALAPPGRTSRNKHAGILKRSSPVASLMSYYFALTRTCLRWLLRWA